MLQHDKRFFWNKYDLPLLVYLLTSRWFPLWPQDRPAPSPGNAAQRAPTASCIVHTHTVCILYNVELHCRGLHRVGLSKRKRQMPSALLGSFHCVYGTGLSDPLYTRGQRVQPNQTQPMDRKVPNSSDDIWLFLLDILTLWVGGTTVTKHFDNLAIA